MSIAHDVKIGHREVNGEILKPEFQSNSKGEFYAVGVSEKAGQYIILLEFEDKETIRRVMNAIYLAEIGEMRRSPDR